MRALVIAALLSPIAAQTTHVVDALGGPGTFPTLQAALSVATHGDVISVLPTGVYDFGLTTNKGVTILGSGPSPVTIQGELTVSGLGAGNTFAMRNFAPASSALNSSLLVDQCDGLVVLEDLLLYGTGSSNPFGFVAYRSHRVAMRGCICAGFVGATLNEATLAASSSVFFGTATPSLSSMGMNVFGGDAHLTNCVAYGGIGGLQIAQVSGIGSVATLAGCTMTTALPGGLDVRVHEGCELRRDAATNVTSIAQYSSIGMPPAVVTTVESGRVAVAITSQNAAASFDGPAGDFGVLVFALPTPPVVTPLGALWCDLQTILVATAGTVPLQTSFAIPPGVPPSTVLVSQGALLHLTVLRLSGPVHALVP